jgi:hypothetical protein
MQRLRPSGVLPEGLCIQLLAAVSFVVGMVYIKNIKNAHE